jgi:hypothetical protein
MSREITGLESLCEIETSAILTLRKRDREIPFRKKMESINNHVRNLHFMGIIIKNGKGIPDFRDLSAKHLPLYSLTRSGPAMRDLNSRVKEA